MTLFRQENRPLPRNARRRRSPRPRPAWSARDLTLVLNSILAGVGGVFLVTTSVAVTTIAAATALTLGVVLVRSQK